MSCYELVERLTNVDGDACLDDTKIVVRGQ